MVLSPDERYALGMDETEGGDVITVLDLQSGQIKLVVSGGMFFGWLPNSQSVLYYQMFFAQTGLWIYDVDGNGRRLIAQPPGMDVTGVAASPDGRTIIFGTSSIGASQVWRANLDGSEPKLLLDAPASVGVFGWSPAGKAILVTGVTIPQQKGATASPSNLWIMDSDGGSKKSLRGHFLSSHGFQPIWSPVGYKIAYVGTNSLDPCWYKDDTYRSVPYCRYRGVAIFVEDVNTGALSLVRENAIDPAWSPDGSLLAFTALDSRLQVDLWISKPDGSDSRRVTNTPEIELHPIWLQSQGEQ
jgi:Tol biopolymer transport system component